MNSIEGLKAKLDIELEKKWELSQVGEEMVFDIEIKRRTNPFRLVILPLGLVCILGWSDYLSFLFVTSFIFMNEITALKNAITVLEEKCLYSSAKWYFLHFLNRSVGYMSLLCIINNVKTIILA